MPAEDKRRRTRWFKHDELPTRHGTYECLVMITSSAPLFHWDLPWDGVGFIVPTPMVVKFWRGLAKRPRQPSTRK